MIHLPEIKTAQHVWEFCQVSPGPFRVLCVCLGTRLHKLYPPPISHRNITGVPLIQNFLLILILEYVKDSDIGICEI